jgi:hypothetical protein
MLLRSHLYYRRTSFARSSLPPTSELKSLPFCMVHRPQTINKSKRLRFGFKVLKKIELTSLLRLLPGHPNGATTIRSSCLPNCQRTTTFSKIWSLSVGSRRRLWSYLIYLRMMSVRRQRSWLTTLNGGHRQSVLLRHSRRVPCRSQLTR